MTAMISRDKQHCIGHAARDEKENEHIPPCDNKVAHICTDMMQVHSVPKLQISVAYYKSKVNEISTPNK